MNKHGQTLVLFVILIPVFLGILALVVDIGLVVCKKNEFKNISKTVISTLIDDENINEKKIEDLYIKNGVNIDNLSVNIGDSINIKNEFLIDSIFGNIIGIKKYKVKVDINGYKKNNKIILEGE